MSELDKFLAGEWEDCQTVCKALHITFSEGLSLFEFNRTAEWNPAPLNGQKITTKFRIRSKDAEKRTVEKQQKDKNTDQQLREKIAKHVCYACEMGFGDGDCAEGTDFRRCGIGTEGADAIIADVINNIKESEDESEEAKEGNS